MAIFDADNGRRPGGRAAAMVTYRAALLVALGILGWALSAMRDDIKTSLAELSAKVDSMTANEAGTKATLDAHGQRLDHIETRLDTLEK